MREDAKKLLEAVRDAGADVSGLRWTEADGERLANRVREAFFSVENARERGRDTPKRVQDAAWIAQAVDGIRDRLASDGILETEMRRAMASWRPGDVWQMLTDLGSAAAGLTRSELGPGRVVRTTVQGDLLDALTGIYMTELFGDPLEGASESYHDPRGPFVAFLQACAAMCGAKPFTTSALHEALRRCR